MQTKHVPAVVGMGQMAQLLQLSRSRLYQLIDAGVFLPPAYLLSNKRPIYTQNMALTNLEVKLNNVGINGQIIIFYASTNNHNPSLPKSKGVKVKINNHKGSGQYEKLIEDLGSLGVGDISVKDVRYAISELYPDGIDNVDEDELFTEIFRHLKCRDTIDNVDR